MAQILLALFKFYVMHGQVPYFDTVSLTLCNFALEIFRWLIYFSVFTALLSYRYFGKGLSLFLPWTAPLWMDFDQGQIMLKTSQCFQAYDVRLMVLSCYCIYPWWSPFFGGSTAMWMVSYFKAIHFGDEMIFYPSHWIIENAILWPPDGILLQCLMFVFCIMAASLASLQFILVACIPLSSRLCLLLLHYSDPTNLVQLLVKELTSVILGMKDKFNYTPSLKQLSSMVYVSIYALSSEDAENSTRSISWDSESISTVVDNSANTHIWNELDDFVEGSLRYFNDDDDVGVLTIDEDSSRPLGVGRVIIQITDNDSQQVDVPLENCLYFPSSPVKIISVTSLAKQFDDPDETWIKTRWQRSTFSFDHGKHIVDFCHASSQLPVLQVNLGFSNLVSFCSMFDAIHEPFVNPSELITCESRLPLDCETDICLVTDAPEPTSAEVRDLLMAEFPVGEKVRFIKNGINQIVDVVSVDYDDASMVPYFTVALRDGITHRVTKEFLSPITDDDIAIIPVTHAQVDAHIDRLDAETLEALLNPPQSTALLREFMAWHVRAGHIPFDRMFHLVEHGFLPRKFLALKKTKLICPSCAFGKSKRKPWRTKGRRRGHIRSETDTVPGAKVSIDHVISAQPGLVPRLDGRHTRDRINSGCVFFDHYSGYSYTHLQTSVDNDQTLAAKLGFERLAASHGVDIKAFHADNGIFAEKVFRDDVSNSNQTISYCAVGAHHQNGLVERHIGTLTHGARTNLLHAQRRWPEAIGSILWPFAWKDFERRYNNLYLDATGRSPLNRFSSTDVRVDLRQFHPFGCPVFVLEAGLQTEGASIPKWDPRARVGIYLGHSPCHAGSVALVLNPKTLRVSPQFHIVFDNEFSTVAFMRNGEIPPHWSALVQQSAELATDEEFDLATTWANNYIANDAVSINEEGVSGSANLLNSNVPVATDTAGSLISEEAPRHHRVTFSNETNAVTNSEEDTVVDPLLFPTMPDLNELTCRRSPRIQALRNKTALSTTAKRIFSLFVACSTILTGGLEATASVSSAPLTSLQKVVLHSERINTHFDNTVNKIHHAALLVAAGDNDTYTLKDMLKQEDKADFVAAMVKEVVDHESRDHWTLMPRSAMPKGTKSILSIWSFKRKRYPDGRVLKHKARLCAHGGMQQWGVNYWETYAPVVNWMSVRTLMALSIIHSLETRSIDFVLAFPQADLESDIYMELPFGFDLDGDRRYILKLNKNLYGLKDASHNFWNLLRDGLEARGYERQSASDSCVFLGKDSIVLVYVDDCVVVQRKGSSAADKLIKSLKEGKENFDFTDDGDLDKYLGVDVKRHKDGRIELTQPHLIERFLEVIQLDSKIVNSRSTPAIKPVLFKDLEGLLRKYHWNYRQAIGMLNYLQATTRPDLAMAVHQAARFCIDPRLSHERAISRIGKYLIGTADKGVIFKPDKSKGLECYVDADFAGGWNKSDATDASTVLSRTGYVIMYAGCPLTWCSKMQTEIALSTTESEYIALSQALREVIPMIQLLKEINDIFPLHMPQPEVHCKVWEDNNGCIALAQGQKFSPRTKHISIKYHHFRQHVNDGTISIHPIDTKEQTADIFTKPLDESLFIHLRKKLCGW
jgi:hypothetical protein